MVDGDPLRVAVVTGAGSGIGRQTALSLAADFAIAACDINRDSAEATAREVRDAGGAARAWSFDVADHDGVLRAVASVEDELGAIGAAVAAGGYSDFADFETVTVDQWDRMLAVHARGSFSLCKAVVPPMTARGTGRIVLVSSLAAYTSGTHPHYAAAKAAMIGFAKSLCKAVGSAGITVNVVAPGLIATPMLEAASPEIQARMADNPVRRVGEPIDVASTIGFLCSASAGFITGEVVHVNGGERT